MQHPLVLTPATLNGRTRVNSISRASTCLKKHREVYGWTKFEVGPNFIIEYRPEIALGQWEIQSAGGAHIGLHEYLDAAIAAVLDLDDKVTLPQDLADRSAVALRTSHAPTNAEVADWDIKNLHDAIQSAECSILDHYDDALEMRAQNDLLAETMRQWMSLSGFNPRRLSFCLQKAMLLHGIHDLEDANLKRAAHSFAKAINDASIEYIGVFE